MAAEETPPTLGALRRAIAARLRESAAAPLGGTPDLDARLLVAAAAGLAAGDLPLRDQSPASGSIRREATAFAARRTAGEPVARIVGHKEFWGLDLRLSSETLIPRPDTETVVEAVLAVVGTGRKNRPLAILDLGTGSGAILLALLSELPAAWGLGADLSPGAITTARDNARRLGLADRSAFVVGNWAAPIAARFDVVVANPPYIPTGDIAGLDAEVRVHDPRPALDGGGDGLAAIRTILADLPQLLAPEGVAVMEIGAGQRPGVEAMAVAAGFRPAFAKDLSGIDRALIAAR